MEPGTTECFLCGTAIEDKPEEIIPQEEPVLEEEPAIQEEIIEEFVCPMCGTAVDASASECPGCGEPFSAIENGDYIEETITEETEEVEVLAPDDDAPDGDMTIQEEIEICPDCEAPLTPEGVCSECASEAPEISEASEGCPICGSRKYSVESGDLVSCSDCGNVYIRKEFEGAEQSWKWKFWVGLVFIIIGDIGVALGSYIHNVLGWSPLGNMYLGYGWIDQMVGVIGIVLFIVGLILFAWSFKREREVQCPSCKVIVLEGQMEEVEEEEEKIVPEEMALESALEEIDEMAECPSCGSNVSMFDTSCGNCGALFEMEDDYEDYADVEDAPVEPAEPPEPERLLDASEIDENEMIMESLELETPEDEVNLNGNGINALSELESAFDIPLEDELEGTACPSCGAMVGKGLDTCPGCGGSIPLEGGE